MNLLTSAYSHQQKPGALFGVMIHLPKLPVACAERKPVRDTVVLELCVCLIRETIKSRSKTGPGNWAWSNVGEAARLVSFLGGKSVYFFYLITPCTIPLALRGLLLNLCLWLDSSVGGDWSP